jgi:glycosyltransferase involved in cell wall biosynthesis
MEDPGTGRPVVLAVGRLAAQKGFDVLLRAAVSWRDMDPRPRVVIVGAGRLGPELRQLAGVLGVDAEFPGRRDDVAALLAAASVVVLPSLWEGQPLILQEALRAGAPVVASRTGGIPDLTGEDAAVLVPPGQPGPLAAAVREVLVNPARADELRAAARDRAASLPTVDDAVAAVLASYATVLE